MYTSNDVMCDGIDAISVLENICVLSNVFLLGWSWVCETDGYTYNIVHMLFVFWYFFLSYLMDDFFLRGRGEERGANDQG